MIAIVILICLFVFIPIGYYVGIRTSKSRFKKGLEQGTGNMGIVKKTLSDGWSSKCVYIEVEELESAGSLIKVKVIGHTYDSNIAKKYHNIETVLSDIAFNEWVDSADIIWHNDNSQKRREEKLEKLLK